jgi:hypothetical protein
MEKIREKYIYSIIPQIERVLRLKKPRLKKPSENRLCRNPLKKEKQKLCGSWQDHKPLDFP